LSPRRRIYLLAILASVLAGCGERDPAGSEATASYEWRELFDGESLAGWRRLDFDGEGGAVEVSDGLLSFGRGDPFTAVVVDDPTFAAPAVEYEIVARARKIEGRDFFCALTFPVPEKQSHLTFVAGGWGGGVTGLSNIDQLDANRNPTRAVLDYEFNRWYELRIEVRRGRIRCYVNGTIVTNASIDGKELSLRPGKLEACAPFGLASWRTGSQFESVRIRALPPE
jgi:hypothetical protein